MEIISFTAQFKRKIIPHQLYTWRDDFPVNLQNKRGNNNKSTQFRLDFQLSEDEVSAFYDKVGSYINGSLSIFIVINQDESLRITVPKRGKNTKALSSKTEQICKFVCDNISVQYIPAVRSEDDAYSVISNIVEAELQHTDDEEYKKAKEYIEVLFVFHNV